LLTLAVVAVPLPWPFLSLNENAVGVEEGVSSFDVITLLDQVAHGVGLADGMIPINQEQQNNQANGISYAAYCIRK
jgi:hypothetical protein